MGMRMMVTVFLLVVLATTVVSLRSNRASDGRRGIVNKLNDLVPKYWTECCGRIGPHCSRCICPEVACPKNG
uniref:Conotoxin Bu24 n=1 Tax=Conus bullatus TaxID=89438 RepID=CA424_CONBU|nr:RecName: Full=Conotoxin Bu24; Flags: Precursor [Conus bullatus]